MSSGSAQVWPTAGRISLWRALSLLLFVAVWSGLAATVGHGFLPTPLETVRAAWAMTGDGTIAQATAESLLSLMGGYSVAGLVGIAAGLAMGASPLLGAVLDPAVDALSAMPRIAFLPLIIVFLGLGYEAKIFMVFLGAVMPILINTYAGARNADPELTEMARAAGAGGRAIFAKVVLPGAMPQIMTGLRVGASLALINTVVAELYTAVSGLGGLLQIYGNSFRMAPYFVIVALLALLGVLLMYAVRVAERRVLRWRIDRTR
jgi:NitT/TauT family transport system permease protein